MIVTHAGQVLFGRRRDAGASAAFWQLPGGWIEAGESPPAAARREVREETGLELGELRFVAVTSNVFTPRRHSLTLYFETECVAPEALVADAGWRWRDWDALDGELFLPLEMLRRSRYRPFLRDRSRTFVKF